MRKLGKVLILSTSILVGTTAISLTPLSNMKVEASSTNTFTKTYYQTTSKLNLRSGAGTKYKVILTIPKSKKVTATKKKGNWYYVSYTYKSKGKNSTKKGWVSGSYLKEYYQYSKLTNSFFITNQEANLYSSPDTKKKIVTAIESDTQLESSQRIVNSKGEIWYRVSFENQNLYISSKVGSLQASKQSSNFSKSNITETTFVTIAQQDLYKEPDKASEFIVTIPNSKIVVASAITSNDWYQINYAHKTGFVPIDSLKQVKTGDPITKRDTYQFIDLRTSSAVTAQQIDDYIEENYKKFGQESVLAGKGQAFIDAGETYGVNALYLAAHAIHESAFGTSDISIGKNNLFGFGSYDATPFIASYRFSSIEENINYIAQQIKATYLSPGNWRYKGSYLGFSTKDMNNKRIDANSEGMNFYYASDPNWGKGITRHMQNILPYDEVYYSEATADTTAPSLPAIPQGSDFFPNGTQAIAKKDLILNSSKGLEDELLTLEKGSTFTILEKTNDYWVNILFEDTSYWTKSINFVEYKTFISVQNLGRAKIDSLNVRTSPDTNTNNIITTLNRNDYVQFALNEDDQVIMDSLKKWYQIQLENGTTGWVSSSYIVRELY